MPYRRNYRRRNYSTYAKHEQGFNQSSIYGMAKAAYSTALTIKDMVNIEYKEHRIDLTGVSAWSIGTAGDVYELIGANSGTSYPIAQGTSGSERIGDSIKLQRLTFRGCLLKNTSSPFTYVRVILFRGKAEQASPITVTEFLASANVFSGKLEANKYNTNTLYDEVFVVDSIKSQYVEFNWNKELNWHVNYTPGANTVGEGGLYALVLSTDNTNKPSISGIMSISYTDD